MDRCLEIQKEILKLKEIFNGIEEGQLKLIEGLLEETAYLKVELACMREILNETGMLKIHQIDRNKQKTLPIANEYRRTINVYALTVKILNSILRKMDSDEDPFDIWLKEKLEKNNA